MPTDGAALRLLQEMGAKKVPRNTITYNAAIQACDRGGAWQHALSLYEKMEPAGVPRDQITHNAVVRACENSGQWDLAHELLERIQAEEPAWG